MYLKGHLRQKISAEPSFLEIYQKNHGFILNPVRIDEDGIYFKAQANTEKNAEVIGFAKFIDDNRFRLYTGGKIEGFTGLIPGKVYFLSRDEAGEITGDEPKEYGYISKPILISDSEISGIFFNMRGALIGMEIDEQNHNLLNNLDYDSSGHTGFQREIIYDEDLGIFYI